MPAAVSKEHTIAKYTHRANHVLCKCTWAGTREQWDAHKAEMRALKKVLV